MDISSSSLLLDLASKILNFFSFHRPKQMDPGSATQMIASKTSQSQIHHSEINSWKCSRKAQETLRCERKKPQIIATISQCRSKWSTDSSSFKHRTHLFVKFQHLLFKWSKVRILSKYAVQRNNDTCEGIPQIQTPLWEKKGHPIKPTPNKETKGKTYLWKTGSTPNHLEEKDST